VLATGIRRGVDELTELAGTATAKGSTKESLKESTKKAAAKESAAAQQ